MADSLNLSEVQEIKTIRNGETHYIYFARMGGEWVDLAPYGNRIPTFAEIHAMEMPDGR